VALNIQTFAQLVSNQAAAIQAKSTALIDFTIGSIMRAWIEATSSVALWLESVVVYVLSLTRAATSQGADLDSWGNDYGITRLSSSFAAGTVTFSRFSSSVAGLVAIGTVVRTVDGSQSFTIALDPTNQAYSLTQNGYVLPIGVFSATVPVTANIPGPNANVAAGTIGLIASATPGIDTVTNAAALTGGATAESDAALRGRIPAFFASLSKGTKTAINYAIDSLQLGVEDTIIENVGGAFYVTVDDGTGTPSQLLVNAAATAVENTRACGVRYGVLSPVIVNVSVSFSVLVAQGYDPNATAGAAGDAVSLPYSRLSQVAYDSSPGILNVENLLLNNGVADVAVTPRNVIKALTVSASVAVQ
jgi:phage-related baseplate assembly protein